MSGRPSSAQASDADEVLSRRPGVAVESARVLDVDTLRAAAGEIAAYGGCDRAVQRLREMAKERR